MESGSHFCETRAMNLPHHPSGPRSFLPNELALLERLCSGDWVGCQQAREQVGAARWAGFGYDGCECFLIEVADADNQPVIPGNVGGPFSSVEVFNGDECVGHLNLWVVDGLLHSVDFMPFDLPDTALPPLASLAAHPFAP